MRLGVLELVVILVIIIFLFGPKQIPKLTDTLVKSIKGFKTGMAKAEEDVEKDGEVVDADDTKSADAK